MAAGAWKIYTRAKRILSTGGNAMTAGGITLGVGVFKMSLHRASASANILKVSNGGISTFASIGSEISARGGYAAGGKNLVPATGKLTVGASTKQMKFTMSAVGIIFSAATSALNNIKYAAIRTSSGAGAGKIVCFCTLSTAQFSVTSGNTLTIQPNALGLFTLAWCMAWSVAIGPAPTADSFYWEPPTQNVDGSAITAGEVTGYEVGLRQGGSPGTYSIILAIDGPFTSAELLANIQPPLPSGLYTGAVRSVGPVNSAWGLEFSFAV